MNKSSIWEAFFSKDENLSSDESKKKGQFFTREISGSITTRLKKILSSRLFRFVRAISSLISHIPARIYGTALLCFGLLGAAIYFVGISGDKSIANPIVSIILSCIAIPFLFSEKPLPIFLQDFAPTDYLFFEFFCMKRHSAMENERKIPIVVAMIIGFIPAILSIFVPFWQIALIIGIVICVIIGMESPEFIFLSSLIALPYLRYIPNSDLVFAIALIIALASLIRKVIYGRRVLYFEPYDIILGIMLLFILVSGIFVKGVESFSGSVRMIILALGYTLSGNLITNRRLANLSAKSVIFSGAVSSVVSVIQLIVIAIGSDGPLFEERLSSILARQDGVATLLMAATVFSFGFVKTANARQKTLLVVSSTLSVLALIISGEFFAIIAILLCIPAYLIIKSNKLPIVFLPLLLAVPVLTLFLPNAALNVIFTYSPSVVSAEELFDLWGKSVMLFINNIFVGIGIGSESFAQEMANMNIFGYTDSSNLFIELGLEAGVFALIFFIAILFVRMKHRSRQYLYVRNSQIELMSNMSAACLFCFLAFGTVNYLWSDISAYYLFWCIFGIGSATLRVAKKDYDDRALYYEESSALDSSVIDIEIG